MPGTVGRVLRRGIAFRAVTVGAGCAVLLVVVYLLAVWTSTGQHFEDTVLRDAAGAGKEIVSGALAVITTWSVGVAVIVIFVLGRLRGATVLGLVAAGTVAASLLTVEVLQDVLPRPWLLSWGYRRDDASFPSGHAAVAVAVTCGLLMVVPHRHRLAAAAVGAPAAAGVSALTVTASWHRPSDTVGSGLIVLIHVCAAILLLARLGLVQAPEQAAPERAAPWPDGTAWRVLVRAFWAGLVASVAIAVAATVSVLDALAGAPDLEYVPDGAITAGRAIALASGGLVVVGVLALLRGIDLRGRQATAPAVLGSSGESRPPGHSQGSGPTVEVTR